MSAEAKVVPALATTANHTPLSSVDSSPAASPSEEIEDVMSASSSLPSRPRLGDRISTGTMIVDKNRPNDDLEEEDDEKAMSPRRNSTEVQKLSDEARRDLIEQAKVLQMSLQAIVDRVETVREEHDKLEGGNKFLQSYIGELMQTSKITASAPSKGKGKVRNAK